MRFAEIDDQVTYRTQLAEPGTAPIRLVNLFTMDPSDVEGFLAAWAADAAFMKRQPGFIAAQLHRGTAGSSTFLNVATWESAHALAAAFSSPAFQGTVARYPDSVVARPHVFTPVAVDGICIGTA